MRAPSNSISAPPLPVLEWINVAMLRMDQQVGRPVLVEFWDSCRSNSMRSVPYLRAWHERYAGEQGLRIMAMHCGAYPPSQDPQTIRDAVARLGLEYPVGLDLEFRAWKQFDVPGWPARYLFDQKLKLFEYHHGEGDYDGTERAIGELLGVDVDPVPPLRPEDAPGAVLVEPTREQAGAWSGAYGAGAAYAVVSGTGTLTVNGEPVAVEHPGLVTLVEHPVHTEAALELEAGAGLEVHAVQFTPGLDA